MVYFLFPQKSSDNSPWDHLHCVQMFVCLVLCCWIFFSWSKSGKGVCFTIKAQPFSATRLLFGQSRHLLSRFLCFGQHVRGNTLWQASALKVSSQSLLRTNSHSCLLFISETFVYIFLCYWWAERVCIPFHLFVFVFLVKFREEVLMERQDSQFIILRDKDTDNDRLFCSISDFTSPTS